ncbi:hypothetical protein [Clostridium butyricum]
MYKDEVIKKLKRLGVNTDKAISRFMGNEELFLSFIFRLSKSINFEKIRKCLEEEDEEQFYINIHNLKGVSSNLEIETLFECAHEILVEFRASKFTQMKKLIMLVNEAECESERITKILLTYKKEEK